MRDPGAVYFDQIAGVYDSATAPEGAWTPPQVVAERAARYVSPGAAVLDVGAGTGLSLQALARCSPKFEQWGVDCSEKMLSVCREKLPAAHLFHGDISSVKKLHPGKFDLILASGVVEFVESLESWISDARSLLKIGGALVFTFEPIVPGHAVQGDVKSLVVPDAKHSLFVAEFYTYRRTRDAVLSILTTNGFKLAGEREFVAYRKLDNNILYTLFEAVLT